MLSSLRYDELLHGKPGNWRFAFWIQLFFPYKYFVHFSSDQLERCVDIDCWREMHAELWQFCSRYEAPMTANRENECSVIIFMRVRIRLTSVHLEAFWEKKSYNQIKKIRFMPWITIKTTILAKICFPASRIYGPIFCMFFFNLFFSCI